MSNCKKEDFISMDDLYLNFYKDNTGANNQHNNKKKEIEHELIGKGSYGKVYKVNDIICYKKFNLFLYESEIMKDSRSDKKKYKDVYIVENNLKEVVFYKLLNRKIKSKKDSFTLTFFIVTDDKNAAPIRIVSIEFFGQSKKEFSYKEKMKKLEKINAEKIRKSA